MIDKNHSNCKNETITKSTRCRFAHVSNCIVRQSNHLFFLSLSLSFSHPRARVQRVNSADDNPPPSLSLSDSYRLNRGRNFVNISRYAATFLGTTKAALVFVYLSTAVCEPACYNDATTRCSHTRRTGMAQHASSRSCLSREARRVEASQRHYEPRCIATSRCVLQRAAR